VPGALALIDLGTVDASQWPALSGGLLARGLPALAVARLTGGTIALGRYQRADTVLTDHGRAAPVQRRWTGGRAIALGEGVLAASLVLPHRSWLVDPDPEALPASRFLNRAVRGLLSGLGKLGIGAYYFGRDFVTVESSQAAYLSFDITPSGAALLECYFAAEAHWWLPSECDALPPQPPQRGVPGPASIPALEGVTSSQLLSVLGEGYVERFGVTLERGAAPSPLSAPELVELPLRSRLHSIPIGFTEVRASMADGRLVRISLNGDFLADSAGLEAAERALIGAEPTIESIAPRLNSVYSQQRHTVLGLPDLSVWAEALIEASGS
jgi:hypothetical protein